MIFTSRHAGLGIVVKPSRHEHDQSGKRVFVAGKKAKFHGGMFKTEDKEIIKFLLAHKDLGVRFHAESVKADKKKEVEAKSTKKALAKKTEAKSTDKKAPVKK